LENFNRKLISRYTTHHVTLLILFKYAQRLTMRQFYVKSIF